MSPPDRARPDPGPERTAETTDRPRSTPAPAPSNELGSAHAAILATQQAAGNQAVTSALGGAPRGVQRAPNDDEPPPGPVVVGSQTLTSAAPRPMETGSQTLTSVAPRPGGGPQPTGGEAKAAVDGPWAAPQEGPLAPPLVPHWLKDPRFAVGGEHGPKPVPEGMFGGAPKPPSASSDVIALQPDAVRVQFERNPARVIRSPNATWHLEAFDKANGFKKFGENAQVPKAFTDGSVIIVAPDFDGPASRLPYYGAIGGAGGPGTGAQGGPTAGGAGAPGGGERPMARMPPERPENRLREAVSPETPRGARGNVEAYRVSFQEVEAAYARDPKSVMRSPNDLWHGQGYRLDGGKGGTPGAYRVGNIILVSPGYPIDNVPYLSVPGVGGAPTTGTGTGGPPAPKGGLPQAAQTVAPGGTTYAERSTLKSYSATTTEAGGRAETRTRSREQAVVTTATEVSEGGITNRQERVSGAGFGVGGNLVGATVGSTDTSKIEGDVVAAKKSREANVGIGKDAKLNLEAKSTKEIVVGTDPDGNPIKQSTATKVGGKADVSGWEAGVSRERTNAKGTTTGAGGKLKGDWKGNVEIEAFINIQTQRGLSFKPTVSRGVKVEASDPIELPDGTFAIVYRIAETTSAGLTGGKSFASGANVGLGGGVTEADFQGGRRIFKDKKEAIAFRDGAAAKVTGEQALTNLIPPTSVAGALQIPVGETRSSGDISGSNVNASAGYSGFTITAGTSKATTREMAIKRIGPTTIEVTGSVQGSKTGSIGASVPTLTHTYSSTNMESFAVTYEFDLGKEQGRNAFELYVKTGWPPGTTPKVIEKGGSQSDNETFAIAGLGTVVWTGTTWQVSRESAGGSTQTVHGGAQIHEQKPGFIGKAIGEDTLKSNAQIVRVDQDGEEVVSKATFNVSGTSGEYNRKEFGKIFMGARTSGDVKPSGEWTLSADIPKQNIQELHRVSRKIRNAIDEKQAYSELVKEGGAAMLGGQVGGGGSLAWDLELKGDPNFPGEKERVRLKDLRKSLMARVRSNPELANDIVRESGDELAKLAKRREAVADTKKYTDLPDQLRQQQLSVIDMHVDDMKVVRRTAQAIAMKRNPGEKQADVAARVEREEKAGPAGKVRKGAPGATRKSAADDEAAKIDAEYQKVQDRVGAKESQIAAKRKEIHSTSKALGDAIGAKGSTALKFGVDSPTAQMAIASGKGYIGAATEADKKQADLEPQIEAARNAWSAATDRPAQLAAIKTLEKLLDDRLKLMHSCIYFIRSAGQAVFHITTKAAKSGNPAFWNSLGEIEGEE